MFRGKTFIFLLIFIGLTLYANLVQNSFLGDDFLQIVNNTKVQNLANIVQFFTGSTYESGGTERMSGLFYRPVMLLAFSVIHALFGLNPAMFHLFQLLLHIANTVLLFVLFRKFFPRGVSFVCSLLFLVHPINNEAVAYIANMQETLFFFFGINALLLLVRKTVTNREYTLIGILLLLSLFSKESGVLFLFAALALQYLYFKRNDKTLLAITTVVMSIYLVFRYPIAHMDLSQTSIAPITNAPIYIRLLNIPLILFTYITTFFFPKDLAVNQFWIVRSATWNDFFLPLLAIIGVVGVIGVIGYTLRKKKKVFSIYLFFLVWLMIGLGLHVQIIPLDATVADRWFYFPFVGVLGLLGILYQEKYRKKIPYKFAIGVVGIIIIVLSIRTFVRTQNWRDSFTLNMHDIHTVRKNFLMDNALGTDLILAGRFEQAKPYVLSSVREFPYYANLNNMAIIYTAEKNKKMAKKYLQKAVYESRNHVVYENYANFLLVYDDVKEAKAFSEKALTLFPKNAKLWYILAQASFLTKDLKRAKEAATMSYILAPIKATRTMYILLQNNKPIAVPRHEMK